MADRERTNLGWLAGSTFLPKKRKEIEGVSATSVLNLQAQVFEEQRRRQEELGPGQQGQPHKFRRATLTDALGPRNTGVEDRDKSDKLHVKSVSDRTSELYAALERKAQLYEQLSQGKVDDDDEKYEVDFLRKNLIEGSGASGASAQEPVDTMAQAMSGSGAMMSVDMRRERERRAWEQEEERSRLENEEEYARRQRYKETVLDMAEETKAERERAQTIRKKKEDVTQQKRDKLKQAFLKKMLQSNSR